jgi:hypothetical protein
MSAATQELGAERRVAHLDVMGARVCTPEEGRKPWRP